MIDYFEGPVIDVPDAAKHLAAARELSQSVLYWLQTEAPRPTAAPASPGCGCAATSPAPRTAWRRRPTSASPGGSGPSTRSSSRTCRSPCAATRARSSYADSVGVGMYRIDLHPSTGGDNYIDVGSLPVRDPARRADPAARGEPAARRQEHRHHPHHQRLLPAAPGRVEHRRGRRRCSPPSASTAAPAPRAVRNTPALLADFQAPSGRRGRRTRAGPTSPATDGGLTR